MKPTDTSAYWLGGALLFVVLYFLSPPFFIAAFGFPFVEAHTRQIEIIYAPVIWLSENCPPYQRYIQSVLHLLGAELIIR